FFVRGVDIEWGDDETIPFREQLKARAVTHGRQPGGILRLRGE
ncbi:hypothetical protein F442_07621, partial [Phytophthora nicotianae P10297]